MEAIILWTAGVVIAMDALSAVLVMTSDCAAFIGILVWTAAAAILFAGVLLPALVRRFLAPFGAGTARLLILATVATAVPAGLLALQRYPHMGHCIA